MASYPAFEFIVVPGKTFSGEHSGGRRPPRTRVQLVARGFTGWEQDYVILAHRVPSAKCGTPQVEPVPPGDDTSAASARTTTQTSPKPRTDFQWVQAKG